MCKELELTWKYPKQYKVISLAPGPDLQNILQDLTVLKVISHGVYKPPTLLEKIGGGDHKHYKEKLKI